jgi:ATP-dependent RNA helicase DDX51/DBP6
MALSSVVNAVAPSSTAGKVSARECGLK